MKKRRSYQSTVTRLSLIGTILLIFLIIIVFFIPDFISFSGNVVGVVIDKETGSPVAGAEVIIREIRRVLYTDSAGKFEIDNLKPGKYYQNLIDVRGYKEFHFLTFEVGKRGRTVNLDTIRLAKANLTPWPIPDDIRKKSRIIDDYSMKFKPIRTTLRLSKIPDDFKTRNDNHGGKWILNNRMITYMNPDGTFENTCPINLKYLIIREFTCNDSSATVVVENYGYSNPKKFIHHFTLNDLRLDSDADGIIDKYEEFFGLNPMSVDTDSDGINDLDDPMPTIAKYEDYNDTSEVLAAYIDEFPIMLSDYIKPVNVYGDIVDFRVHPTKTCLMYIPTEKPFGSDDFRKFYGYAGKIRLIKMDSTAAIIHDKGMGGMSEIVMLKRDSEWIVVHTILIYHSSPANWD